MAFSYEVTQKDVRILLNMCRDMIGRNFNGKGTIIEAEAHYTEDGKTIILDFRLQNDPVPFIDFEIDVDGIKNGL